MVSEKKADWREKLTPKTVVKADDLHIIGTKILPGETYHGIYFSIKASDFNPYMSGGLEIDRENNPKLSELANNVYGGGGEVAISKKSDGDYLVALKSNLILNYCHCVMSAQEFKKLLKNIERCSN